MAGVVPVIRVLQESLAGAHVERIHGIVNGTTNFILTEMARGGDDLRAPRSQRAQELGYAEADPTDDVTGRDAAAKMAILARLAFSTPGPPRPGHLRGHRAHHRRGRRLRARPRPRAEADRHRGARRRRDQRPRAPGVPVSRPPAGARQRLVQRRHDRVRRDHRDHALRPRRGRPADRQRGARRRDQRDDPARLDAGDDRERCRSSRTSSQRVLPLDGGRRRARRARAGRRGAGHAGRVDQVGAAARARRPRAADDGPAPAAGVALLRRRRSWSRGWRSSAPSRARSASSTRSSNSHGPDHALPRAAAVRPGRPGRLAGGGLDAARARRAHLRARRRRGLAQARGREPDRLLQGPRDDVRGLGRRPQGRRGRDLRLHRQHRRDRSPPTPPAPGCAAR